ncbi:MAG: type II secretion system protein [Planctomycetota bacterium]|nr:type II secretion system protein [Planctomycetota bacterium]
MRGGYGDPPRKTSKLRYRTRTRGPFTLAARTGNPAALARRRGFTLVELLIVIAIIAVLAALFVPAAALALGLAHTVVCQNNLRNIAVGYRQYLVDSGGLWPPMLVNDPPQTLLARIKDDAGLAARTSNVVRAGPHWSIVLWPYIRTVDVYTCPADPKKGLRGDDVVSVKQQPLAVLRDAPPESYGLNAVLFRYSDAMRRRAGCNWGTQNDSDYRDISSYTSAVDQRRQFPALDSRILFFCGTVGQSVGSQYNIAFRDDGLVERWEWHPRRASAAFADEPGSGSNYLFVGGHIEYRDELPTPWEWGCDLGREP